MLHPASSPSETFDGAPGPDVLAGCPPAGFGSDVGDRAGLPPPLDALGVFVSVEVVAIGRQPDPLTVDLARLAAFGLLTELLAVSIPPIRDERFLTVVADSGLGDLGHATDMAREVTGAPLLGRWAMLTLGHQAERKHR